MVSQILRRAALSMDELHTLLLGVSWARGDVLPFYIGSVTRYEGGSWLLAWPVSWLLRLGASGTAATTWTAGTLSLLGVALGGYWVTRVRGLAAGATLGLLLACVPELVHYSYRAWGSIQEALFGLPLLALLYERWRGEGRGVAGAVGLGVALAGCIILSYVHMVTALAFVAVHLLGERGRLRGALGEVGVVAAASLASFGVWVATMLPFWNEAGIIRDGRPISSLLGSMLLPRVDRVVGSLPGAWVGQLLEPTPLRLAAGVVLSLLVLGGAVAGWRAEDERRRWPVVFLLCFLPALSVGHALQGEPGVFRYYLPLFAVGMGLVALWDLRAVAVAVLCGLTFWLPRGLEMPYQNPALNYLELGGNAMHRFHLDPHSKFVALREVVPDWYRPWFAFGYGVDSGQRFSRARKGMRQTLSREGDPDALWRGRPHFSLWPLEAWTGFWDELEGDDERQFLLGMGMGFCADGVLDEREAELLDVVGEKRAVVLEGFGAAVSRGLEAGVVFDGWDAEVRERLAVADYAAVGRGVGKVRAVEAGVAKGLGVPEGARREALLAGQAVEIDLSWRAMASVPLIATPEKLTDEERGE